MAQVASVRCTTLKSYPEAPADGSIDRRHNADMCMAFPMQVLEVDGLMARCEARGSERRVNLLALLDDLPAPGDHLLVHLDRAVQRIGAEEAAAAWVTLDEIAAALARSEPTGQGRALAR